MKKYFSFILLILFTFSSYSSDNELILDAGYSAEKCCRYFELQAESLCSLISEKKKILLAAKENAKKSTKCSEIQVLKRLLSLRGVELAALLYSDSQRYPLDDRGYFILSRFCRYFAQEKDLSSAVSSRLNIYNLDSDDFDSDTLVSVLTLLNLKLDLLESVRGDNAV